MPSMAASEYLSTRLEETERHSLKASLNTGMTYIITVAILILPYLLPDNDSVCLALFLICAVYIIAIFYYFISVAKDSPFRRQFTVMSAQPACISSQSRLFTWKPNSPTTGIIQKAARTFVPQWYGIQTPCYPAEQRHPGGSTVR